MKKESLICICTILILLLPCLAHAQFGSEYDDVTDVPIDGGLSLLLAAGIGYGTKKVKHRSIKKSS